MARTAKQIAAQRAASAASAAKRKGKSGLKGTPVSRAKATPLSQRTEKQRNQLLGYADDTSAKSRRISRTMSRAARSGVGPDELKKVYEKSLKRRAYKGARLKKKAK